MRRQGLMAFPLAAVMALAAPACTDSNSGQDFSAILSGRNEVPERATAGSGAAGFNFDGTRVHFVIEVDDISNVTQAHIHSGAAGVNGPVRVFLFPPPPATAATTSPFSTSDRTVLTRGSFDASNVGGVTFDQLLAEMRAGTAYVNVHTTQFPGGEIRGQIQLQQ